MKAAVIPQVNAPWEIREVATPRPGPGQVLLKVHACGLCHNDLWTAQGVFPFPSCDPAITGHEAAGEVVEVGPGTTSRQVGDRVGTTWVQATCGRCSSCRGNPPLTGSSGMTCAAPVMTGLNVQGGHAEYLCVAAASTVLLPDGLDYATAAPVLCAGYTAWSALRASEPQPHERIAVLGIGGLGHMALQYARASGFETVALTRSPDKHALAAKLGADLVVRDGEELREAGGADVVLVTGTSYEAATDALRGLRVGGRVVLATIDPVGSFRIGPNAPTFWARGQRVLGASHDGLGYLTEALDLVARGDVTPMTEVFPMERITDAVDKAARGEVRFRAVVTY
ncbi:alcohol dehydrogenase/alcohol dehydrogenase, propanol-preferring [Streptomyces sp. TverLS-915]|uniref:alcohol dehydrogenase catalytic domain-containing protein n=1 Tax=Streptomyces sp. TverLS-915 TaxID=1839763 RepID=UPI00081F2752|nr:alcohol dehydrogenase catalytic domain-containing protein [Streptomyces sp. TverLS-915]SCE07517.1 alcohol dehydrogenase/alcohol dehydrogenase, propanol-preferring [Streptomyces sp. TverLS-915]